MAWKMTHEQTEVGFEVVRMEHAKKHNHVVTYVKYPTMDTVYTYIRKYNRKEDGNYATTVDGCEVRYNPATMEVVSVKRLYDTHGMKKQTNPGSSGVKTGDAVKSIKQEMSDNDIEVPKVEVQQVEVEDGPVRHEQYETIKMCLESNIPVYLAGPAGSGKNHTVEQICEELGWGFYFSNSVQQEYKLTGFIDAGGHSTKPSFTRLVRLKKIVFSSWMKWMLRYQKCWCC